LIEFACRAHLCERILFAILENTDSTSDCAFIVELKLLNACGPMMVTNCKFILVEYNWIWHERIHLISCNLSNFGFVFDVK
jgi:hypothetical protein